MTYSDLSAANREARQTKRDDSPPHTILWNSLKLPDRVTALPVNPSAGDVIRYEANSTNDIVWWLYYDKDSTSTYKWKPLGVVEPYRYTATNTTTRAVAAYGDAASGAATTFTLPLAGDYLIRHGGALQNGSAGFGVFSSYSVNGATALDTDSAVNYIATDTGQASVMYESVKTALAAGTTIQQKFKAQGAVAGTLGPRFLTITPVRVG